MKPPESANDANAPGSLDPLSGAEDFFEMSLDHLCVAGLDGYLKRVNPSWTRTLGWTAEELLSRPSVEFVHPEDRDPTLAGRHRLRSGTEMGPLVNRYLCKDGTFRWFEWCSVAHPDRGLVYAAARDITDQKLAEVRLAEGKAIQDDLQRQLIVADRMASVGTLASGVAHEINNPLGAVMANVAMLLEDLERLSGAPSREQVAEMIAMATDARAEAERIRAIVRRMKTFSRADQERRALTNVTAVVDLAIEMAFSEIRPRARFVKQLGATPPVHADDARLAQVFMNLLLNAAQSFMEAESDANEIRIVTSTDADGRAVVAIEDNGAGIAPAHLERIFDPFFTTKPIGGGTGLGLFVCHTIVSRIGGTIAVSSVVGGGTTFRVTLPAAHVEVHDDAGPEVAPRKGTGRAAVLVVDDEPGVGRVLCRVLREHEVTVASGAQVALELLGSGKHFDVIFSDLMMPVMSGMAFYDELTRRFPDVCARVVFLSGGAFTPAASAFLDRVTNARMDKPFDPGAIRTMVERFIR